MKNLKITIIKTTAITTINLTILMIQKIRKITILCKNYKSYMKKSWTTFIFWGKESFTINLI
jgi:hypothetical protein